MRIRQSKKAQTKKAPKRENTTPASSGRYRFKKLSYTLKYTRALSYLHELEESEIDLMVASSRKVAATP